jgi:FixJ family two-component response regulator
MRVPLSGYVTKVQYREYRCSAMLSSMANTGLLIAVVDDEPRFCSALARLLKTHGFDVETFTRGNDFLAAFTSRAPDCVLLDLHMPEISGFEILERLAGRHLPVLVITGHDQPGNAERVRAVGGTGYLLKPVNETQLLDAVRAAINHPPAVNTQAP